MEEKTMEYEYAIKLNGTLVGEVITVRGIRSEPSAWGQAYMQVVDRYPGCILELLLLRNAREASAEKSH